MDVVVGINLAFIVANKKHLCRDWTDFIVNLDEVLMYMFTADDIMPFTKLM